MREILGDAIGATRATASAVVSDLLGRHAKDPLAERDPGYIRETLAASSRLAKLYFRPKVRGLERIPAEGPVLLVGNHSGGTLIADTFAFSYAFYNRFGPDRLFFQLAHDFVFRVPGLLPLRRYGTIPANHENAMRALERGAALLVYPGGDHETYRPSWHSGEIDFGHRTGFVRLALRADVPIVPLVAVGGQETALFLTRGERIARLLGLHRLLRIDVVPIQIAPPFGVTVLDLPGRIPLPSQITVQALPEIDLRRRFGPDPDVEAVYNAVTTMMQEELDELSAERDLPILGRLGRRSDDSEVVDELEHGGLEREVESAIESEERHSG
ncbi:MAG TPA: lysophospholipid acyltransferase family protein [Solirubrobacterales bacterium]